MNAATEAITNLNVYNGDSAMRNVIDYEGTVHLNLGEVINVQLEYSNGKPILTFLNPATGELFFMTDRNVLNIIKRHLQ